MRVQRSRLAAYGRRRPVPRVAPTTPPSLALTRERSRGPRRARRSRPDETEALLAARGDDLERLMAVAARLRELGHGHTVTYSRKVFIPLTMLCRDHCHYCTFAKPPAKLDAPFLAPEEVVAIAEAGRRLGCKEALFTLGDRPEDRYPRPRAMARASAGYASTLDYVRAVAIRVIEETGPAAAPEPGRDDLGGDGPAEARERLDGPDARDLLGPPVRAGRPALRLARQGPRGAAADDRGRRPAGDPVHDRHPRRDRRDARASAPSRCSRSASSHRRYRHVQEVIVQNFRAKPGTAMQGAPEPG